MDIINQIQITTFATLADTINVMNNHTLITHFGVEPTTARFVLTLTTSICHLTAAVFQASELFIIGQIFSGLQLPLRLFVTLLFITECAPDRYRGFASTALVFSDVIGQTIMFSVGSPNVLGKTNTWFIFPLFVMISSCFNFCITARLPESPKWLVRQNRMEEAARATEFYHGHDCSIEEKLSSFIKEKNLTIEDRISLRQVLENDTLREALKVLFSVSLFLIFDSASVQGTYTVLLHQRAGFTVQEAMNINLILTVAFFPTKFIGTYIIDALGRRPVMAIGGIIIYAKTWLMLATQTIIYFFGSSALTRIMFISVQCLAEAIPATGVTSLGILFITELFPPSARTSVAQAMMLGSIGLAFPISSSFPIVYSFFTPGFFMPPIITQFLLGTYLFRYMPETRARAVCDIIEAMDQEVASRTASVLEEKIPLIRDRASTFATKRNSILNTSRTRALTFDHNLIQGKYNC
uniref:MFS domain-containing protein n=1 Tax=Caenorhabditis japonica TaxID=281687 RepID=A0A8R1HN50_CAEJA